MKTLTITKEEFENSKSIDQAECTCRALDFDGQEWSERILVDNKEYEVYYLFEKSEITYDDGSEMLAEDYDWSYENIDRVEEVE